jgi:hypothetical protein
MAGALTSPRSGATATNPMTTEAMPSNPPIRRGPILRQAAATQHHLVPTLPLAEATAEEEATTAAPAVVMVEVAARAAMEAVAVVAMVVEVAATMGAVVVAITAAVVVAITAAVAVVGAEVPTVAVADRTDPSSF